MPRNNTTRNKVANFLYFCNMFHAVIGHHQIRLQYPQKKNLYQNEVSALQKSGKMVRNHFT